MPLRYVARRKEELALAVNTSGIGSDANRAKGAALKASDFNPDSSNDDGAMVLNRDEAKELFRVIVEHSG